MRRILLGLVITGFALVVFITVKPQTAALTINPESPGTNTSEELITLESVPYFTVVQGGSDQALFVTNNSMGIINFSLAHEHAHLTFHPQGDKLTPGSTRKIFLHVDPECPVGEIELPVYLRGEANDERVGMDTVILLNIIYGELSLESDNNFINVLWNKGPAPPGVLVFYRSPGEREWRLWGETPWIDSPGHLTPGNYKFEFRAELGEVQSAINTLVVEVEEIVVKTPKSDSEPSASVPTGSANETPTAQESLPPPEPGTMRYLIELMKEQEEQEEEDDDDEQEESEEPFDWWESE